MSTTISAANKKGRLSLPIDRDVAKEREQSEQQINLSPQAEQLFARTSEELENRSWVERNGQSIKAHGRDIAATGLAGAEFDRI
jgi:hypothetical protein